MPIYFDNPFSSEDMRDELDERLRKKSMSRFSIDNLCIMAPTKCGSTSMRRFIQKHAKAKGMPITDVTWTKAETRIVIIRDPWSRYYSGLTEMFKWPDNMNGDATRESWNNCWNDHINEIYGDLWNSQLDFQFIQMKRLPEYIGDIHLNRSAKHQAVMSWLTREEMDHSPWVKLHIQRDFEWLQREQKHFNKIVAEREEVNPHWWKGYFNV